MKNQLHEFKNLFLDPSYQIRLYQVRRLIILSSVWLSSVRKILGNNMKGINVFLTMGH